MSDTRARDWSGFIVGSCCTDTLSSLICEVFAQKMVTRGTCVAVLRASCELLGDVAIDVPLAPKAIAFALARGLAGLSKRPASRFLAAPDVETVLAASVSERGSRLVRGAALERFGLAACVLVGVAHRMEQVAATRDEAADLLAGVDVARVAGSKQAAAELLEAGECAALLRLR